MQFKELKVGFPVFILDKESMTFIIADVISVGTPYFPPVNNQNMIGNVPNIQRIVDITVSKCGENHIYSTNENSDVCYCKTETIATDKNFILNELKTEKKNLEAKIAQHDKNICMMEKCNKLLGELDDEERTRQFNEKRLDSMEKNISKLSEGINDILRKISKNIEL